MSNYDVIVIGSGMGGLTVASLAAQLARKRVLVLERHFKPGGFTHDFRRGRFQWDVGLHYVGELGESTQTRKVMDLVTGCDVAWTKMPDPVERFTYPDLTFDVPVGKEPYLAALIARFPEEEAALRGYFKRIGKSAAGVALRLLRRGGSPALRGLAAVLGVFRPGPDQETTKDVHDATFQSPALRALLASIWGTYGLPPEHSAFAVHALLMHHYMNGAWYPTGGAGRIAESVKRILEDAGGRIVVRREVTEILVEDGRAVGVHARSTAVGHEHEVETFRAPVVVSNTGAATTWGRLVPDAHAEPHRSVLRAFLDKHPVSTSASLYLGLSDDPRTLGFRGENHWIYESLDHDAMFRARGSWLADGDPPGLYLSFPSMKDPEARTHTAEVLSFFVDYDDFAPWRDEPWRRRGAEYEALKRRITGRLLAAVDRHHLGFSALVEHAELSTPITNEHFTNHPQGRIYGLPLVPGLFHGDVARATHPRTTLPGLFLTGADAALFGIVGTLMTGVTTLSHLPGGPSMVRVFRAAERAQPSAGVGTGPARIGRPAAPPRGIVMTLDRSTLPLLDEALAVLEEGFARLPPVATDVDRPAMRRVVLEAARRMQDNFPYHHPLYVGQMLKPPHPAARLAYALSMWLNPNNHALDGGRASSAMEKEAVAEIAGMVGWQEHLGHLCGGGTMANLEALWVARELAPGRAVLASEQAHYTHGRLCGVLSVPFRTVATDGRGRMDPSALERELARGDIGTVVVTLGTTALGAVDPLHELLPLCRARGVRVHLDAAYGGFFALASNLDEDARRAFDATCEADSYVVDPHKHGLQPYGCGCVLFRDPGTVGPVYQHDSPYTYFTSDELHLGEISLECSRPGAAAVALWTTSRLLPYEPGGRFAHSLEACRQGAVTLHARLADDVRFVPVLDPQLDIVVWTVRASSAAESSRSARAVFEAAAKRDLHLALATLPAAIVSGQEPVTCLRACVMKPDHEAWLETILERLDAAAHEAGLRP